MTNMTTHMNTNRDKLDEQKKYINMKFQSKESHYLKSIYVCRFPGHDCRVVIYFFIILNFFEAKCYRRINGQTLIVQKAQLLMISKMCTSNDSKHNLNRLIKNVR